ncbi:MAG: TolC family protein [Planctomycetes bacterium]|nr:TolC family protein [Planctomycetota bacterium]
MIPIRSFRRMVLVPAAGLLVSCGRVDHQPEFRQAVENMQHATGLAPPWTAADTPVLLQPDEQGLIPLDRAVEVALANNRALRADLEVIAQAKADLVQAGLLSNPMLSLMTQLPEGGGRVKIDFGLTKDMAELWLIPSRKRAAQRMLQQRVLSFTDTAVALLAEVKATYHVLQYQHAALDLQEENLKVLREALELAQARFRAGETSQLDVNLTRGRLLEVENEVLGLKSEYGVSRQTLLRLAGAANASESWTPAPLDVQVSPITVSEEVLVEAALARRLDAQAAWWETESAVAEVEQQRLRYLPSLALGISGERSERRAIPGRKLLADTVRASLAEGTLTAPEIQSRAERRRERRQEIDFMVGPTLEVPLPIFDQNHAQIAKAQARARELARRYDEIQQRVIEGVRSSLLVRRLAEARVELFEKSLLPQQEANLEFAEKSYQAGQETILTVLLAQESLIRSRLSYVAAQRDLLVSTANLERQLSGRLPEFVDDPPAPGETAEPRPPATDSKP